MRIINDFSYIGSELNQLEEMGIYHLRFDTKNDDDSVKIMELLEENFKVYQYKNKDNYEERELFFWTNSSITNNFRYFTIGFKEKAISKNYNMIDKLLMLLIDNLSMLDFEVYIQYTNELSKEKIKNYLNTCVFDINKMDFKLLGIIESEGIYYGKHILDNEEKVKLNELSKFVKEKLTGKRFKFNGIDGKLKMINDKECGFFKLRARNKYYIFELRNIRSIELL